VTAQATPSNGAAPLQVTLTATGAAATYHWDLGDGAAADGPSVQHTYAAGRFTARVTATNAGGETSTATVAITATGLTLAGPRSGRYQQPARFHGRLVPAVKGARLALYRGGQRIATARAGSNGAFVVRGRVGTPDSRYTVRYAGAVSNQVALSVRPGLDTSFSGSGRLGTPLALLVRERPAAAGTVSVKVWRGNRLVASRAFQGRLRLRLATASPGAYRVRLTLQPAAGYLAAKRVLQRIVFAPSLEPGSSGASAYELDRRLHQLHYALGRVDGYYGQDDVDAVFAFQKLHGLARTGRVDARFWVELQSAAIPQARYPGNHVEISKGRQVLFLVRDGKVALTTHVSTGATGNTPLGEWHVYSKVVGWSWVLWYPSYFLRGFAIHGYPDVPAYPASHGCVRIPMWLAPKLFGQIPMGSSIYIYT
jgi:PKD repeat protein